jgi:hypothetical protein
MCVVLKTKALQRDNGYLSGPLRCLCFQGKGKRIHCATYNNLVGPVWREQEGLDALQGLFQFVPAREALATAIMGPTFILKQPRLRHSGRHNQSLMLGTPTLQRIPAHHGILTSSLSTE